MAFHLQPEAGEQVIAGAWTSQTGFSLKEPESISLISEELRKKVRPRQGGGEKPSELLKHLCVR